MFRLYTKTFGGKIWSSLHRVFPGNIFGQNETASRAKKCTRKRQFLLRFFQKMVWLDKVFLDYNYLHEMCGSFYRKSIVAS